MSSMDSEGPGSPMIRLSYSTYQVRWLESQQINMLHLISLSTQLFNKASYSAFVYVCVDVTGEGSKGLIL